MNKPSEMEAIFDAELKKQASGYTEISEKYSGLSVAMDCLSKAAELVEKLEDKKASEALNTILENLAAQVLKDVEK